MKPFFFFGGFAIIGVIGLTMACSPPAPTPTRIVLPDVPKGMTVIRTEGSLRYYLDGDGTCYRVNLSGYETPAEKQVDKRWYQRYVS